MLTMQTNTKQKKLQTQHLNSVNSANKVSNSRKTLQMQTGLCLKETLNQKNVSFFMSVGHYFPQCITFFSKSEQNSLAVCCENPFTISGHEFRLFASFLKVYNMLFRTYATVLGALENTKLFHLIFIL